MYEELWLTQLYEALWLTGQHSVALPSVRSPVGDWTQLASTSIRSPAALVAGRRGVAKVEDHMPYVWLNTAAYDGTAVGVAIYTTSWEVVLCVRAVHAKPCAALVFLLVLQWMLMMMPMVMTMTMTIFCLALTGGLSLSQCLHDSTNRVPEPQKSVDEARACERSQAWALAAVRQIVSAAFSAVLLAVLVLIADVHVRYQAIPAEDVVRCLAVYR